MKLSLAWIFDHLQAPWTSINIKDLVAKLNETTAEVEEFTEYTLDLKQLCAAKVLSINDQECTVEIPEKKKKVTLPSRKDLFVDARVLLFCDQKEIRWASLYDLKSTKEGLVPPLLITDEQLKNGWRDSLEAQDYTLTIDNKSLTHRPDLWSHRGFAREIGALLDIPMQSEDLFLASKPIKQYERSAPVTESQKIALEIADPTVCKRLAGIYVQIDPHASIPAMVVRLARVDARPINAIVDSTNYVMLDIGQPMHAFDADKIPSKKIVAQLAKPKSTLALLDGQTIELTHNDIIISDGSLPLSLAGIMGGASTAISGTTKQVFFESGSFDAGHIRKSSTVHKRRTESSIRFEKSLDPNLNTVALLRALKLLETNNIRFTAASTISSVGKLAPERTISLSHELIIARLGRTVTSDMVVTILTKLGFGVTISDSGDIYVITVPTFRATKDVTIKEDIIEEIGRFMGYASTATTLPLHSTMPVDNSHVANIRTVKHTLAFGTTMHEVCNYALYDAEFLQELDYNPTNAAALKNPVSEHWRLLVTSLVPHLLKNVVYNKNKQNNLAFFELARTWHSSKTTIQELKTLSGIFADCDNKIDFYTCKNYLEQLFNALKITIDWTKPTVHDQSTKNPILFGHHAPWWHEYQTAELLSIALPLNNQKHEVTSIGYAGMLSPEYSAKLGLNAFIFELDAEYLINYKAQQECYKPAPKFQPVTLDISVLVQTTITVAQLRTAIANADARITHVQLLERYENPEWQNQRSHTFRFTAIDPDKTMTKEEIDDIWDAVIATVTQLGGTIR